MYPSLICTCAFALTQRLTTVLVKLLVLLLTELLWQNAVKASVLFARQAILWHLYTTYTMTIPDCSCKIDSKEHAEQSPFADESVYKTCWTLVHYLLSCRYIMFRLAAWITC